MGGVGARPCTCQAAGSKEGEEAAGGAEGEGEGDGEVEAEVEVPPRPPLKKKDVVVELTLNGVHYHKKLKFKFFDEAAIVLEGVEPPKQKARPCSPPVPYLAACVCVCVCVWSYVCLACCTALLAGHSRHARMHEYIASTYTSMHT